MLCVNVIGTLKSFLRPVGKQQSPFFLCGEHGGFADRQVASIQFYRGCCPRGVKGQRHYGVFSSFFFVEPVIYSCASHKVNPPSLSLSLSLSHTHSLFPIREESGAAVVFTSIHQLFWVRQQQSVIICNLEYLSYVSICFLLCSVIPVSVYSPVVLTCSYVFQQ